MGKRKTRRKKGPSPGRTHTELGKGAVAATSSADGEIKTEYLSLPVRFRIYQMDLEGPWGWTEIPKDQIKEIFEKLGQFESIKWGELNSMGKSNKSGSMHHSIDVNRLSISAQSRLEYLNFNGEEVYSLRLNSTRRIYGLRDGQWLNLLWYDPNHDDNEKAVVPTNRRDT